MNGNKHERRGRSCWRGYWQLRLAAALAAGACAPASPSLAVGACGIEQVNTDTVLIGDTAVYVEPGSAEAAGDRIALLGFPTYLSRDGSPSPASDDALGVIVAPGASAAPVLVRPPASVRSPAVAVAASVGPRRWRVILGELTTEKVFADRRLRGLHSAVLVDGAWLDLEELPLPRVGEIDWLGISEVVTDGGDKVAFAAPVRTGPVDTDVVVYRRDARGWSSFSLGVENAAYVAMGPDGSGILGVVRPDGTQATDHNSLFVHALSPTPEARLLARGGSEPIHAPRLTNTPDGVVASWWVQKPGRREARARSAGGGAPVLLDSSVVDLLSLPYRGGALWILQSPAPGDSGELSLRFLHGSPSTEIHEIGTFPSQFQGPLTAVVDGSGTIHLFGPSLIAIDGARALATLRLEYKIDCD